MIPSPRDFKVPPKFTDWRHGQDEAILRILDSPKRFVALAMPTGTGKSLAYVAAGLASGSRVAILTSTKGLQTQVLDDFKSCGLVDIRGMANYPCRMLDEGDEPQGWKGKEDRRGTGCDIAPCHVGHYCQYKGDGCYYYDAYRIANKAKLVVTNYSYWMHIYKYGEGLGTFDMLVLDEAHKAPEELASFVAMEIKRSEFRGERPTLEAEWPLDTHLVHICSSENSARAWKRWATPLAGRAEAEEEKIKSQLSSNALGSIRYSISPWKLREVRSLARRLRELANIEGEWIVEIGKKKGSVKFDPLWAAPYAERLLFKATQKVVLSSATIRPKTATLMGIRPENLDFLEFPSIFPKENRPFIWVPTARIGANSLDGDLRIWLDRIDEIVGARLDRKGIIHTVSYARRDLIMEHSVHAQHMISHATESAEFVVKKFKKDSRYKVLVSPSMATGWDFPDDECRYQIIAKVPFPDTRVPVTAARMRKDREYIDYVTSQQVIQTYGRGVRSESDWCECFVIDDHAQWFIRKARQFFPKWFKEALILGKPEHARKPFRD